MSTITDLRSALFATLTALQDKKDPMDIDRARAVCDVARELTATAKVEIDYMRITGNASGSGFIDPALALPSYAGTTQTANGTKTTVATQGGSVTTHRTR